MADPSPLEKHWRNALLTVFGITALLHFAPVYNYLDNDDAWNYVLEAERVLAGQGSAWVEGGSYLVHQNLMRLLGSLSWIVRYALFDLWMPAWHLPSILLHALNAVLLVVASRRLGLPREGALLAGLLFGLSPLHPHVVSWVGGTYDIFAGAFMLGSLIMFIDRRTRWGLALLAGAMMSKETGAFMGPILALYVLLFERAEGMAAAVKRLWPYAAVAGVIVALRLLQIRMAGSIDAAGLPARTVAVEAGPLFAVGPTALFAGLGAVLRPLVSWGAAPLAGITAGALAIGLGLRRAPLRAPALWLCVISGWMLLIPVLVMREEGAAMSLDDILMHQRYLYLPLLMAAPAVALALFGLTDKPNAVVRGIAGALAAGSLVVAGQGVLVLTQVDPAAKVVVDTLTAADIEEGANVFVLANTYEEGPFRVLMSRWLGEKKRAAFHFVQRGSWRSLQRNTELPFGLDFKDYYVRVAPEPFGPGVLEPQRGDRVFLLSHRGPAGGHKLTEVELPSRDVAPGAVRPLEARWTMGESIIQGACEPEEGALSCRVANRLDRPGGYPHRPLMISHEVHLSTPDVWGLRLTYRGTRGDIDRRYSRHAFGYAELHWVANGVPQDDTFVVVQLELDGQEHHVDVPLWFDPVWRRADNALKVGFVPYDAPAEIQLLGAAIIDRE